MLQANRNSKKAQEELIGFGVIITIVLVIILVFLVFSLTNKQESKIQSYEVDSFILGMLQHTTSCETNLEFLNVKKLIFACYNSESCLNGENSCEILNSTMSNLINKGLNVGEKGVYNAYYLEISTDKDIFLNQTEGKVTINNKEAVEELGRNNLKVILRVYEN